MALSTSVRILLRAARQFGADGASQMGAALAYYALFSTAPLLVLAVMLTGQIFGEGAARERVVKHLTEIVGPETAREVNNLMESAAKPVGGGLAAAVGGGVLLLGALSVFLHIRRCLSLIWRLDSTARTGAIKTLLNYMLAILMVLCVVFLLLLSLAASTALPLQVDFLGKDFPVGARFWHGLDAGFSFALLTLFFAVVFRVMSGGRILWPHVLYGSVISSLLFTAGKTLISLYLAFTGTASAYGRRVAGRVPGLGLLFSADRLLRGGAGPGPADTRGVACEVEDQERWQLGDEVQPCLWVHRTCPGHAGHPARRAGDGALVAACRRGGLFCTLPPVARGGLRAPTGRGEGRSQRAALRRYIAEK